MSESDDAAEENETMTRDELQFLLDYNAWAYARVWAIIDTLTDAQFNQDTGYSFGSIRQQVTHCMSVERRWAARLLGEPVPDRVSTDATPGVAAVRTLWHDMQAGTRAMMDRLTDADLLATMAYTMPQRGGAKEDPRGLVCQHVMNHATDHRAQILAMLHMLGVSGAEQDIILYAWERQDAE
jgi:uncharacterized damage-inducible protein DinB